VIAQRLWPQRPDFVALGKTVAVAVVAFAVTSLVPDESLILSLAFKMGLFLGVVALSVLVGAVDRRDVSAAVAFLRRLAARSRPQPLRDAAR
jgi:hypothetical protein